MTVTHIVTEVPKPPALLAAEDELGRLQQEEIAIFGRLNKLRARGTRGLLLAQAEAIERQIAEDNAKSGTLRNAIAECRRQIDAQRPEYATAIAAALAVPRRAAARGVIASITELRDATAVLAAAAGEITRAGGKATEPAMPILLELRKRALGPPVPRELAPARRVVHLRPQYIPPTEHGRHLISCGFPSA